MSLLHPELLKPSKSYASIAALIEACGENGTHSILDIDHVSDSPEYGGLARIDDEQLIEIFGTASPSREVVVGNTGENRTSLMEHGTYELGSAVYVVLFKGDAPDEIYIEGCTGD
jgi:hypothetical protein